VDFLRAISIVAVVIGHWLIAAPYVSEGGLRGINMLAHSPWTQWLTWVFQVMPVFFAVGGYSNSASWAAAQTRGQTYAHWLTARLRRLTGPLVPLLGFWAVLGVGTTALGVDADLIRLGSQSALIPVWFLAVYLGVTALSPLLIGAWSRYGWGSFIGLVGAAAAVDLLVFGGWELVGWLNFAFVWCAIHQLGVAWRGGRLGGTGALALGAMAAAAVAVVVTAGPYPIAMVGVPGAVATNNSPPTLALAAYGTMQVGLLLAMEARARRFLDRPKAWTATILVNGSIMTLYLWHLTVMVLTIGGMLLLGGAGLGVEPATATWWLTRPLWVLGLTTLTLPVLAGLGRYEQVGPMDPDARPNIGLAVAAAVAASLGLALLAEAGIQGWFFGVRLEAVALPIAAAVAVERAGQAAALPPSAAADRGE
jgi:fucose 4-O-acetylase-like acetyltransferase